MIVLLPVLALQICAYPVIPKTVPGLGRLKVAFTNDGGDGVRSFVWAENEKGTRKLAGYTIRQWVEPWKALLVSRNTSVYRWQPERSQPELLLDVSGPLHTSFDGDQDYPICSVDPSGQKMAVIVGYGVSVIDLRSKRVTFSMSESQIGKKLRRQPQDIPSNYGIAWNPRGSAVAIDIPTKAYRLSSDGSGPAQCVVVYMDGRASRLGLGAPIAWLSDSEVLCAFHVPNSDVEPVILGLGGSRPRIYHRIGMNVGWDGRHVLLSHTGAVEVIDRSTLKRLATVRVPELEWVTWYPTFPLVGIPH